MTTDWFAVDKEGLASLLERRGKWFVVYELIQNAIDENGVTNVEVTLTPIPGRPLATLTVRDDAPDGFADLTHSFRLFAPSKKKGDAEKRGRFNLGEKLVLAVCEKATVASTTGTYRFGPDGRTKLPTKTDTGSVFTGVIRMTRADIDETATRVQTILPPVGVKLTFNGSPIDYRVPLHSIRVTLPTEIANDEGQLRPTSRVTHVDVHEPAGTEVPMIYEMGIPVVESGDRWHLNVGQKVPLNMDRDNVTPAYLRALRVAVLNEMHSLIQSQEDATQTWVTEAIPHATPEAVRQIVTARFGANAVTYDPSDPEANKIAAAEGRTVIPPGAFTRAGWRNVRATEAFLPAGQVTPSNSTIELSADGKDPVAEDAWTDGQRRVVEYAHACARAVLGFDVEILICSSPMGQRWAAAYGHRTLRFNVGQLGHRWFDTPDLAKVDALLIHEYAHEYASDHLSSRFYDACCDVGARMKAHAADLDRAWLGAATIGS